MERKLLANHDHNFKTCLKSGKSAVQKVRFLTQLFRTAQATNSLTLQLWSILPVLIVFDRYSCETSLRNDKMHKILTAHVQLNSLLSKG